MRDSVSEANRYVSEASKCPRGGGEISVSEANRYVCEARKRPAGQGLEFGPIGP